MVHRWHEWMGTEIAGCLVVAGMEAIANETVVVLAAWGVNCVVVDDDVNGGNGSWGYCRTFSEFLHQPCDNITVTFPMADGATHELGHVTLSHGWWASSPDTLGIGKLLGSSLISLVFFACAPRQKFFNSTYQYHHWSSLLPLLVHTVVEMSSKRKYCFRPVIIISRSVVHYVWYTNNMACSKCCNYTQGIAMDQFRRRFAMQSLLQSNPNVSDSQSVGSVVD